MMPDGSVSGTGARGVLLKVPRLTRSSVLDAALLPMTLCVVVGVWEAAVRWLHPASCIVPSPGSVFDALADMLASGLLASNFLVTFIEAFAGFIASVVFAVALGILVGEFRTFEKIVYPYLAALQAMPKVALAPLIVIWFGFGFDSKVILAALIAFFPMLVNTVEGLKSVDEKRVRLLISLDATRWQILYLIKLPNAMPFLVAGVELAATYSMLGAIVAEFVAPSNGIGSYMLSMTAQMQTSATFALLGVLAAYGAAVQFLIRLARAYLLFWVQTSPSKPQ